MRLYLSSFRLGNHASRIVDLVRTRTPRVLAIMNALDSLSREKRQTLYHRLSGDLAALGADVRALDLRQYFANPAGIGHDLSNCDMVWANGGNVFTLRAAMKQKGCDRALRQLLEADAIAYGGYSAGAIVATPTLRGIDLVDSADPADAFPADYAPEVTWEGMSLVPFSLAPHYRSNHPESERIESVVQYFADHGIPYRVLRDGEAIVIDGADDTLLTI